MKFPGSWVNGDFGKAVLERSVFDETELDATTTWKQSEQICHGEARCKGYVELEAALWFALQMLPAAEHRTLGQAEKEFAIRWIRYGSAIGVKSNHFFAC
jgi:hypothetical protein